MFQLMKQDGWILCSSCMQQNVILYHKRKVMTLSDTALSPSPLITHLSAYSSRPFVFYNNHWFFINLSFKFSYSLSYQTETVVINTFHRKLFVVASFVTNATGI
jgi:hypothetical protein